MAADTGSIAFFAVGLLVVSTLVLLLLRHYLPLRSTPAYLTISVFLALVLPSSIVLLVPIDLATSAVTDEDGVPRGIWLPGNAMLAVWRIVYWLTFTLTWLVLPLLGDYTDSGNRETRDRIMYSVRKNLRYQLIVLLSAAAGLTYFFLTAGVEITNVKAMVISLAYAWGLVIAIYLMGHGLVALPRRVFRSSSISNTLKRLQTHAPTVHERMKEAIEELEELEAQALQLQKRKTGAARGFHEWIEELADTSDLTESQINSSGGARLAASSVPAVVTERYLADLSRKLKRARHKRIRFIEEWDLLVRSAVDKQTLMDCAASKKLVFDPSISNVSWIGRTKLLNPYTRYILYYRIIPALSLGLASFSALASAALIWSEVTHSLYSPLSIVGLSLIHHPNATDRGKIGFAGQMLAAAWLMYMCITTLASVREVKVWGNRALVPRHTYSESATWYAMQIARLTVPLSYNFITLLPPDIYHETAFYRFLGKPIDTTPLGEAFSRYFPILILIPALATTFNLYGRIKRIAGFGVLEEEEEGDSPFGSGGWREGKALIDRERNGPRAAGGGSAPGVGNVGLPSRDASPDRTGPGNQPYRDNEDAISGFEDSQQQWASEPHDSGASSTPRTTAEIYRDEPVSSTTAASSANARAKPLPRPGGNGANRPYRDEEDDDEDSNFFSGFAQRVKNTIDTIDKPDFSFNFKKPKWLPGGDPPTSGGGTSADGDDGPFSRFFGRNNGGGLRL